jgi:hypothetical protein
MFSCGPESEMKIPALITKALGLSEDLNLPPPVPLPFAQRKTEEQAHASRYIG